MVKIELQEPKAQRWRALAILSTDEEALICLGSSIGQVREYYAEPWFDLFDEEVRLGVKEIRLQKWNGNPDRGEWVLQTNLPIPVLQSA